MKEKAYRAPDAPKRVTASSVLVTATLSAGGQQSYLVTLVREGIGWKVDGVSVEYPALDGLAPEIDTGEYADDEYDDEFAEAEDSSEEGDEGVSTTSDEL